MTFSVFKSPSKVISGQHTVAIKHVVAMASANS